MRPTTAMPVALFAFAGALALTAAITAAGPMPESGAGFWSAAMLGGRGQLPWGSVATTYPPIPFLSATLLQAIAPSGTPGPALLAAGLFALLAVLWLRALQVAGLPKLLVIAAAPLILLHPLLLQALIAGPEAMFLALFLYLFAAALFDLRARTQVREVMTAGLSLLGLAFSHPMGAASAIAAVPLLGFAVRPVFVATSAINIVLALIFPVLAGAAGFAYLSWAFPGESLPLPPLHLAAAEWLAAVAPASGVAARNPAISAVLATIIVFIVAAPLPWFAAAWVRRRRPLLIPTAIFAATAMLAVIFAVGFGLGDPVAITAAAPVLSAVVLARVPIARERHLAVVLLLLTGYLGGVAGLKAIDPRAGGRDSALMEDNPTQRDALALGGATRGREGVLIDAFNAPAAVLGRGDAAGLLPPRSEAFAVAIMCARIDAPFVAVPDPRSRAGAGDRLNKAFPGLYRDGWPGYRLIYQNKTWRLFARERPDVYANWCTTPKDNS